MRRGKGWADERVVREEIRPARKPAPVVVKRFVIRNEYWEGWATWRRKDNVWACVECSERCEFLRGLNRDQAKLELLRRGCQWAEVDVVG